MVTDLKIYVAIHNTATDTVISIGYVYISKLMPTERIILKEFFHNLILET